MEHHLKHIPWRIAVSYLVIAAVWILASDGVLALLVSPVTQPQQYATGQMVKGWLFVGVTAVLLYLLLQKQFQRLSAETAARQQVEQQQQALLQAMPLAVIQIDPNGFVQFWNQPATEMFGWTAVESIGHPLPYVTPEQEAEFSALRQRVMAGESFIGIELERVTKKGNKIFISLSTAPVRSDGRITGIMAIIKDITERKQHEVALRRLNTELEQRVAQRTAQLAAKNKELETFAYSVSHDLKAPLRGIDGYGRLLLEDYADSLDEEGALFLLNIRQATGQMAQLIDDLLAYSRLEQQTIRHVTIDLAALVETILLEQQERLKTHPAHIRQTNLNVTLQTDPNGLAIILRNLLDNALKFTKEEAEPTIEIGYQEEGAAHHLWVKDNGIGFEMQFHDRIFEIFQRLHRLEEYPGTGIGLALAQKAAKRMSSEIWADSAPGNGAIFHVTIPQTAVTNPPPNLAHQTNSHSQPGEQPT